jgi:hypothetical protein
MYFMDTNKVMELLVAPREFLREHMRELSRELLNAGWCMVEDLSHSITGYPQITLEANTGQHVQLQVSDMDDD